MYMVNGQFKNYPKVQYAFSFKVTISKRCGYFDRCIATLCGLCVNSTAFRVVEPVIVSRAPCFYWKSGGQQLRESGDSQAGCGRHH